MDSPLLVSFELVAAIFLLLLSAGAAALAINLYSLLRTGKMGSSWRVLIIASVLFALVQVLRFVEVSGWRDIEFLHLSSVVEIAFVLSLAYSFYLQRQIFIKSPHETQKDKNEQLTQEDEDEPVVLSAYERDI
jgi:hypothetical protein